MQPSSTRPFRPSCSIHLAAVAAAVVLAIASPAQAQYLLGSTGLSLRAWHADGQGGTEFWAISKGESYNPTLATSNLQQLGLGILIYANDHNDNFPALASDVFAEGYVTDPRVFYSPGDANDPPVTIDNDVPDAANSGQVSFEYRGATADPHNPWDILAIDNTPANHAGLGRAVLFVDGHREFQPEWPHPFMDLNLAISDQTPARIWRDGQWDPYTLNLPGDVSIGMTVAPHHHRLTAEGTLSQDLLDVFAAEGFDDDNLLSFSDSVWLILQSMRLPGPAGPDQPLTVYVWFDSLLTVAPTDLIAGSAVNIALHWEVDQNVVYDVAWMSFTPYGLILGDNMVLSEHDVVGPGETGYVPGATTVAVQGVAQLLVTIPPNTDGLLYVSTQTSSSIRPNAATPPGYFGRSQLDAWCPATPAVDQVKLYVPAGYSIDVDDWNGPGDVVVGVQRGDLDLDGQVGPIDRAAFGVGYTGPLVSQGHAPTTREFLQTFDFEGDADIDCADYAAFTAAWTAGGSPAFFAACDLDGDADGIPNGDDDCPATTPGTTVDERGCRPGDVNADDAIDVADYATFFDCLYGPDVLVAPTAPLLPSTCLNSFDFDDDRDVDVVDYAAFQRAFDAT